MIDFIQGKIVEKYPTSVILNTNNIGYQIYISINTFVNLPDVGSEVTLKTYLHVREDNIQLYGFMEEQERIVFTGLISISGVGPKLAQTILSGIKLEELIEAIQQGDFNRLTSISGVGKKTAQRLILELREKFSQIGLIKISSRQVQDIYQFTANEQQAVTALISLGYKKQIAEKAISQVGMDNKDLSVEAIIKQALQNI